ncbi:tyrosine-type recombinase/integrase [Pseudarthrobacter sp. SSS035]|uniref:tyrosine-type recombinase/integrase n=1 Tax=Pseudarthrobacter sp. SSS035 TaxID=2931399 RepID=UPI00353159E3
MDPGVSLAYQDLQLNRPAHLLCHGKGRKDRITPLDRPTAAALRLWVAQNGDNQPDSALFTRQGGTRPISRDAVAARLRLHGGEALPESGHQEHHAPHAAAHHRNSDARCRNRYHHHRALARGRIHQSTQAYLHADLGMKERALNRLSPPGTSHQRYAPTGQLLTFLESL